MKKIILWGIFLSVLISSCVNENYIKYSTDQKDAVYINLETINSVTESDSVYYNFGFDPADTATRKIWVRLMGLPRDYDRTFGMKVITNLPLGEGLEYAKPEYYSISETLVLKADSLQIIVPVILKRHKDLENKTVVLALQLTPTEDLDIRGQSRYLITFDDKEELDAAEFQRLLGWWDPDRGGEYSKLKVRLFYQYFWETADGPLKIYYDRIVKTWGQYLNKVGSNTGFNNPLRVYSDFFNRYVFQRLYEYYLEHPNDMPAVPKPKIN